jgi:hypothetical protein
MMCRTLGQARVSSSANGTRSAATASSESSASLIIAVSCAEVSRGLSVWQTRPMPIVA